MLRHQTNTPAHRGPFLCLSLSVLVALNAAQARAGGALTLEVHVGNSSFTFVDGGPDTLPGPNGFSVDVSALNADLIAAGSQITFAALGAENFGGGGQGPRMVENFDAQILPTTPAGITTIQVDAFESQFINVSRDESLVHMSGALFTNAAGGDSQTSSSFASGDWRGGRWSASPPETTIGPPGGTLLTSAPIMANGGSEGILDYWSNSAIISLTPLAGATVEDVGSVSTAVPEPTGLALMLTGIPLPLLVVALLRRRRNLAAG